MSIINTSKTMAKFLCIAGGGSLLDVENECEKQFVSSNTFWIKTSTDTMDLKKKFVCRKPAGVFTFIFLLLRICHVNH